MASGDTLIIFTPLANEPPTSNYATLDTRNNHPCLDFDASTNESAIFSGIMPQSYAGTTGITVYLHYAMSTATSGDIDWDIAEQFLAIPSVGSVSICNPESEHLQAMSVSKVASSKA